MIPFRNRFHGHGSLRFVYQNGQTVRSHLMTIKYITNPHRKSSRLAVIISKKVLKSAVGRNRIRRRVYEYIRPQLLKLDKTYDIAIIISSNDMLYISQDDLINQIDQLFDQSGVKKTA